MEQRPSTPFMRMSFGTWNPQQHLVSVIEACDEARFAAQALRASGIAAEHIHLLSGAEVLANVERARRRLGPIKRALLFITDLSDNTLFEAQYLEEAQLGRQFLIVYLPRPDRVRQVSALLERYHAFQVRYYGRWMVTDVVSAAEPQAAPAGAAGHAGMPVLAEPVALLPLG